MKQVIVELAEELRGRTKEEQLQILDEEVTRFSRFMADFPDDPRARGGLIPAERVLLKTYLISKLRGRLDPQNVAEGSPPQAGQ